MVVYGVGALDPLILFFSVPQMLLLIARQHITRMTTLYSQSLQHKEGRAEVKDIPIPFVDTTQKLPVLFPFTSCWLEFSHMAMPSCKGFWEM